MGGMTRNSDKFLIGIVAGIVLLVVVAFVVVLNRPNPTYRTDDAPDAVAHNYLLALWQEEYERAYSYLSPDIAGYPESADLFIDDIRDNRWIFDLDRWAIDMDDRSVGLEVVAADVRGNRAYVDIRKTTFYQGDFFSTGQSTRAFEVELEQNADTGEWLIVEAGDYWVYCWSREEGCDR